MSNILNTIKEVIASSVKVEVKTPVTRHGKVRYPILVTDVSQSFTSGWFVQYNPVAQDNGTRLYDGSESFSELQISRYSELYELIMTANYYFLQGNGVEVLSEGRTRAIYEPNGSVRLTVTSQRNSTSVVVTIVDENSPFNMLSIPFTVTPSNTGDGSYYIVGSDKYWDRNTDTFQEFNANFAPRKGRFYRVKQEQNGPATLKAKLAVKNNQYAINQDGTFEIDTNLSSPEYIQVISNEYKALAYIYEQALMTKAFELAISKGLPIVGQQNNVAPQASVQPATAFVPAFSLPNAGQPNPVQPVAPSQSIPLSNQQPQPVGPAVPQSSSIGVDLPWGQN